MHYILCLLGLFIMLSLSVVERNVPEIIISAVKLILNGTQSLAEALIVHYLTFAQELDGLDYIRIINKPQDIIVGGSCLLLRSHVLMQVGYCIAF